MIVGVDANVYSLSMSGCVCLTIVAAVPLTLPNRINCPLLFCAILFCSGFHSDDRITITGDSYFRWGIFACQPACLNLSSFCHFFLVPFLCSAQHAVSYSLTVRCTKEKSHIKSGEQMFSCYCVSAVSLG